MTTATDDRADIADHASWPVRSDNGMGARLVKDRMQPSAAEVTFDCTMCGRCCTGLRLPLAIDEAIRWIDRGGVVELLCDAAPVVEEADHRPSAASYRAAQAIPARSGTVDVDIALTIVATFAGPCPFLRTDMSCGNYEQRPRVCRIYPAEANPFRLIDPAAKACPDEAWDPSHPVLLRGDRVVDAGVRRAIEGTRIAGIADAPAKARLAARLGIDVAAFANEGLAVHAPARDVLRSALVLALSDSDRADSDTGWRIASNRAATRAMLAGAGCAVVAADESYIGYFPADVPLP